MHKIPLTLRHMNLKEEFFFFPRTPATVKTLSANVANVLYLVNDAPAASLLKIVCVVTQLCRHLCLLTHPQTGTPCMACRRSREAEDEHGDVPKTGPLACVNYLKTKKKTFWPILSIRSCEKMDLGTRLLSSRV